MRTPRRWFAAGLAIVTMAALSACGGAGGAAATDPGLTDDSILLGSHLALTGPAAPGLQDLGPAWNAYFNYVNAQGGIHGRKIKLKYYDDAYNPANAVQVVRKLVQQDRVFAMFGGVGTPTHSAVLDFLKANNVPDLLVTSGGLSWNQPDTHSGTFGWQPTGVVESKIIAKYVEETYGDKKICALGQDGELGEMGLEGFEQVAGSGAYAKTQTYTPTDPNIEPQIVKLRDARCEVVTFWGISAFAALALNAADKVGWHPIWVGASNNNDYGTLVKLVADAGLLEGFTAIQFLPPPQDHGDSWNKLFKSIWEKYGNGNPYGSFVEYGLAQAYTAAQAIEAAGPDLTRTKLVAALTAADFDPNPGYAPLRYSTGDHAGYSGGRLATVRDGVFKPFGEVYSTTEDADTPVTAVDAEPAEAPSDGLPW